MLGIHLGIRGGGIYITPCVLPLEHDHHLQHHARHTDESNTRYAGTHHTEGHQIPLALSVTAVERIVVRPPCRPSAQQHQYAKVHDYGSYYHHTKCEGTKNLSFYQKKEFCNFSQDLTLKIVKCLIIKNLEAKWVLKDLP